jgi:hypothetical protein
MKRLLLAAFLVITSSPALAQIQHGTVVVLYYPRSQDKIIIAADSRALSNNPWPDDTVCKIAAPHGKLVFSYTGIGGYVKTGPTDPVQPWSAIDEIYRAYDRASSTPVGSDRILRTAREWGRSVAARLESNLSQTVLDTERAEGGLTQAVFGGLGSHGKLVLFVTRITLQEGTSPHVLIATAPLPPIDDHWWGLGEVGTVAEFDKAVTPRAKAEAKEWTPPKDSKPEDYAAWKTIRFVDLSIQDKLPGVGGKIDAVQMNKDGSVHWFAIKANCAKD